MLSALYPILDDAFLPREPSARAERLAALARGLEQAGVTILQYRNKQGSDAEILADAAVLRAHTTMQLILNDRADLVGRAGFGGVHLGQEDMPAQQARALIGGGKLLGLSTHNEAQLRAADATTADYLAIGPIFATSTKANPDPVVGLEGLRRARALTRKPLVAIGGITLANAAALREAGADAVAVISALFPPGEPDHESTVKIAKDFLAVFR